jgi:hypothetical protein
MATPQLARTYVAARETDSGTLKAALLALAILPVVIAVIIWDCFGSPEWGEQ